MNPFVQIRRLKFYKFDPGSHTEPAAIEGLKMLHVDNPESLPGIFCLNESMFVTWKERFAAGHTAVLGTVEDAPAHLAWIALREVYIGEVDYRWKLEAHRACIYDCRTADEFRGRGIYPYVLRWIAEELPLVSRKEQVWIYCEKGNISSLQGIEKAGFVETGEAATTYLFGYPIHRSRSLIM